MFKLPETKGNLPWLNDRTIFATLYGSKAYGTNIATSDTDIRGVAIAPKECYLGFLNRFEQAEFKEPDAVIYELQKFMKLASDANPSVIEVLFTDERDHLRVEPLGQLLLDNRELFLSKKVRYSFAGYAMSQLKRIETHRKWLLNPPTKQPERKEFGLPEMSSIPKEQMGAINKLVQEKIDSWQVDWDVLESAERIAFRNSFDQTLSEMSLGSDEQQFTSAMRVLGFDENFVDLIRREKSYQQCKKSWAQFNEWKINRNAIRSEMEAKHGFDCKNASHLVRLCRMASEILQTGKVLVRRPDAKELLEIRNGSWSYDQVVQFAKQQDESLSALYLSSTAVPMHPDRKKLDKLCVQMLESVLS